MNGADVWHLALPFIPAFLLVFLVWTAYQLVGEQLDELKAGLFKEFRELIKLKWTAKSLNALTIVTGFIVVVLFGGYIVSMMTPQVAKAAQDPLYASCLLIGTIFVFLVSSLLCIVFTKHEI